MSWANELYNLYDKNYGLQEQAPFLLPISHSTANAQIEILITEDGDYLDSFQIVDKEDSVTVIPVSEDSGARSSGITPHPLNDKLVYVAGDYSIYGHKDNSEHFAAYLNGLETWASSEYTHPSLRAIKTYVEKKCLMQDLIKKGLLQIDSSTGRLQEKVKVLGIDQSDLFVRFQVVNKSGIEARTWCDRTLFDCFIDYNNKTMSNKQLCYATGRILPSTYKHPSKIRNAGDKAKLISTNDESGFSYRGRFRSKEDAISVSYDFSQKAHNALKWLIAKQGNNLGSLTMIAWESALQELPDLLEDSESFLFFGDEQEENDTFLQYRKRINQAVFGYKDTVEEQSKAMVLGLDAATTGRLSVSFYSELATSDFLENIGKWHIDTSWRGYSFKQKRRIIKSFSLKDIVECAYGTEQGDSIKAKSEVVNGTICRLIPCVVEGTRIPDAIMLNLFNKAVNPSAYSHEYNWRKVLEITCAIIRKKKIEKNGDCDMGLDRNNKSRDYLYGRLLAVADALENSTYSSEERRTTNAKRLFNAFANRPYRTWGILHNKIGTYKNKLPYEGEVYYTKLLEEIMSMFNIEDYRNNARLEPEFLHAYYCQLQDIYTPKKED